MKVYGGKKQRYKLYQKGIKMTREEFEKKTGWRMSYEEFLRCDCTTCTREQCVHRDAYRRVPKIDGGLGLCPNLVNGKEQ